MFLQTFVHTHTHTHTHTHFAGIKRRILVWRWRMFNFIVNTRSYKNQKRHKRAQTDASRSWRWSMNSIKSNKASRSSSADLHFSGRSRRYRRRCNNALQRAAALAHDASGLGLILLQSENRVHYSGSFVLALREKRPSYEDDMIINTNSQ